MSEPWINLPDIAAPVPTSVTASAVAAATSISVPLPATVAVGELLTAHGAIDAGPTVAFSAGWFPIALDRRGTIIHVVCGHYPTSTTPSALTVTVPTTSRRSAWHVYRWPVSGSYSPIPFAGIKDADVAGSPAAPDTTTLTPTPGAANYTFVSSIAVDDGEDATGYPSGYSGGTYTSTSSGTPTAAHVTVASAYKTTTAASSEDPGAFTLATAEQWRGCTTAIVYGTLVPVAQHKVSMLFQSFPDSGANPAHNDAVKVACTHGMMIDNSLRFDQYIEAMRVANPDLICVNNVDGSVSINDAGGTDFAAGVYAHEDDATTRITLNVAWFGGNDYVMEVTDPAWTAAVIADATDQIHPDAYGTGYTAGDYDAIFFDDMGDGVITPPYVTGVPAKPPGETVEYTSAEWYVVQGTNLATYKAGVTPKLAIPNGIGAGHKYLRAVGPSEPLAAGADYALAEIFLCNEDDAADFSDARTVDDPTYAVASWKADVDMGVAATAAGEKIICEVKRWLLMTADEEQQWYLFSYATFLLGFDLAAGHLFSFFPADSDADRYEGSVWFDPLDAEDLGEPLEGYVADGGIYRRRFERGVVLCNPSSSDVTGYALGGSYAEMDGAYQTSVDVDAYTGLILFGSQSSAGVVGSPKGATLGGSSSVTENLQALGSFDLDLHPDTPTRIRLGINFWDHVIVTAQRVDVARLGVEQLLYPSSSTFPSGSPSGGFSIMPIGGKPHVPSKPVTFPGGIRPLLDEAAIYTGVVRELPRGDRWTVGGVSPIVWLGDEDDKGDIYEVAKAYTADTFKTVLIDLLPSAVAQGQIYEQATDYTGSHIYTSPRKAIEYVCDYFGCEYRVNPNCSLDAGTVEELYGGGASDMIWPSSTLYPGSSTYTGTLTPTAVLAAKTHGTDPQYTGLHAAALDVEEDVEDWSSRVIVLANGSSVGEADIASNPFKDLHGNPAVRTRAVFSSETTSGNADRVAQSQLARFTDTRSSVALTLADYDVDGDHSVGHTIYVYDPDLGLVDPGRQVRFRGQVIFPTTIRVVGATWPVTEEMGVYWRDQAGVYTDITDFVLKSSGSVRLEVGAPGRRLIDRDAQREALRARVV